MLDHATRLLVGAGAADRDHAARSLDRDALAGADHVGAGLAGGAAARRGRARRTADGEVITIVAPSELRSATSSSCGPAAAFPPTAGSSTGSAEIDESMVTGESRPVRRGVGDTVVAGTVATDSGLRVEVTAVGDDTALAGIQRLVDRGAELVVAGPAARRPRRGLAVLVRARVGGRDHRRRLVGSSAAPRRPSIRTITVLVIACPHALGLAIPLVVSIATERAAPRRRAGQGPARAGEHAHRRCGAVRQDRHADQGRADRHRGRAPWTAQRRRVLALAAAAESDSEHPARPRHRRRRARRRGLAVPRVGGLHARRRPSG